MENRQKPVRDNLERDVTLPGIQIYAAFDSQTVRLGNALDCDGKLESKGGPQPQTRAYLEKIYPQAKLQKEKERSSQSESSAGGCGQMGGQYHTYSCVP